MRQGRRAGVCLSRRCSMDCLPLSDALHLGAGLVVVAALAWVAPAGGHDTPSGLAEPPEGARVTAPAPRDWTGPTGGLVGPAAPLGGAAAGAGGTSSADTGEPSPLKAGQHLLSPPTIVRADCSARREHYYYRHALDASGGGTGAAAASVTVRGVAGAGAPPLPLPDPLAERLQAHCPHQRGPGQSLPHPDGPDTALRRAGASDAEAGGYAAVAIELPVTYVTLRIARR